MDDRQPHQIDRPDTDMDRPDGCPLPASLRDVEDEFTAARSKAKRIWEEEQSRERWEEIAEILRDGIGLAEKWLDAELRYYGRLTDRKRLAAQVRQLTDDQRDYALTEFNISLPLLPSLYTKVSELPKGLHEVPVWRPGIAAAYGKLESRELEKELFTRRNIGRLGVAMAKNDDASGK